MELLYWLESIRTPVLDAFFSTITHLGAELVFMVLAVVLYWCIDKAEGLYLLSVGALGTTLNQFLKLAFRIPRPWVKDPNFTIVETARADATGYSFPSGHTQSVTGVFGALARDSRKQWFRMLCIILIALTAFSRMYLGVHTPMDMGVSLLLGTVLVFALYPLKKKMEDRPETALWLLGVLAAINAAYWCYAAFFPFPADSDAAQIAHGVENGAKLTGALIGMSLGCLIDIKVVRSSVKAPILGQILKVFLGLAGVLAIKEGMRFLPDSVRYGLMTFFAAGIWPMAFPLFQKCGKKMSDDTTSNDRRCS
ncbi:MAG: phosphatase PAP2 family protein [Oscillospiraceae bacterium]|nr:phosphatase PAP2 family protein [Oscillospiraceae bacterium]